MPPLGPIWVAFAAVVLTGCMGLSERAGRSRRFDVVSRLLTG
jgi:hypothetical protein